MRVKLTDRQISVIIVLLAICGSVLIFYFRSWRGWGPVASPAPTGPTVGQTVAALLQLSPISFPKITSQKEVAYEKVPASIKLLIAADARNLKSFQAAFEQNKSGFHLVFDVPQNLRTAFAGAIRGKDWQILKSAAANKANIIVLENSTFQVQILQTYLSTNSTQVSIITVGK